MNDNYYFWGIMDILEIAVITLKSFYIISEATKPEQ